MIENMIREVKEVLPLKISTVIWDDPVFQIYAEDWNFTTLNSWRITSKKKMILGCSDKHSSEVIEMLTNLEIIGVSFQNDLLKIDPIFFLSNGERIEIFSTDAFEPWTFQFHSSGLYIAMPSDPELFEAGSL